ncbi:MAG: BadF/BadG/BcrA/BcrD ATPase family protein [Bacteroidota bacterium]
MILIADSGSTKTAWALLKNNGKLVRQWTTEGMNPYQQKTAFIIEQIKNTFPLSTSKVQSLYYYGAGATYEASKKLSASMKQIFKKAENVDIQSDMLASAYALCGDKAGIVCILGTGSNSCVYDGKEVLQNIGGFGFILGDEGSGAIMGKQLMCDFLYKKIPNKLREKLCLEYDLREEKILQKVYKEPFPNRFLASFAPFLKKNMQEKYVKNLIKTQTRAFFEQKVLCYENANHYSVHFTGSVAYFFQDAIKEVAASYSLKVGKITQAPMVGLIQYHQRRIQTC